MITLCLLCQHSIENHSNKTVIRFARLDLTIPRLISPFVPRLQLYTTYPSHLKNAEKFQGTLAKKKEGAGQTGGNLNTPTWITGTLNSRQKAGSFADIALSFIIWQQLEGFTSFKLWDTLLQE